MNNPAYDPEEPIAALATAWGESALAVVRLSGTDTIEQVASVFSRPRALREARGNTVVHGMLVDGEAAVDEVMIAVYRAPRSYTGQDSAEIFCHGSPAGVRRVLALLRANGFRDAEPGEFTLRSFLNKKMDLTQAEAVREIVGARSAEAHHLALHRLEGRLRKRIDAVKTNVTRLASVIEIGLDYPEDEVPGDARAALSGIHEARRDIAELLATYRIGRLYQEGVRVALCGRTNAGKSSLFNLLLREDRSIVSDTHGTTRDFIESTVVLDGIPVTLYDTAGLRSSSDAIEAEGIKRSEQIIEAADLTVYLVDGSAGEDDNDRRFIAEHGGRPCVRVWNKADIASAAPPGGYIAVSATTGTGIGELTATITGVLDAHATVGNAAVVIDSARQKELLERADEALLNVAGGVDAGMPSDVVALDIREALDALGEITGEVTSADILDTMFAGFCVGK